LQAGDKLQLGAGRYDLLWPANWQPPSDVAISGSDVETIVNVEGAIRQFKVERWRFTNLAFALGRAVRHDVGLPAGTLHFQGCRFENVFSPFGVLPSGGVQLVEGCLFSSMDNAGRIHTPSAEPQVTYFRGCRFVRLRELATYGGVTAFDDCQAESGRSSMILLNRNRVLLRDSPTLVDPRMAVNGAPESFLHDTDDVLSVLHVLGEPVEVEPRMRSLAERLRLARSPAYWLTLLRHPDVTIRLRAVDRLRTLLGVEMQVLPPAADPATEQLAAEIGNAIRDLDSGEFGTREAARNRLFKLGTPAVEALRRLQQNGTPEQRRSAEVLLEKVVGGTGVDSVPAAWEKEYGRLSRWYTKHRTDLVWQEAVGGYRLASNSPDAATSP
jgi:hypothetical protein